MTPYRRPANWDAHLPGGQVRGVQENTAAKVAEAEATAKAGELQATSSEARKASAEDAQADLDAIARMASEGGPSC